MQEPSRPTSFGLLAVARTLASLGCHPSNPPGFREFLELEVTLIPLGSSQPPPLFPPSRSQPGNICRVKLG